jgi:AmiR/NasT family two-component response regulator
MTTATDIANIRTYTLEEIDDNLATLSNLLKTGKKVKRAKIILQVDNWLERRLELTEAGGD